jgi:hypothetical protein
MATGYAWQRPYEAAILGTDRIKLPTLIDAAHAAISVRLAEIERMKDGTPSEMQAIDDARSALRTLIAKTRAL